VTGRGDGTPAEVLPELIGQLRPRLAKVLRRYRIPVQDAEDLIQETLTILVSKGSSVHNLAGWLIATVGRRCIIYWRRRRRAETRRVEVAQLPELPVRGDQERRLMQLELNGLSRPLKEPHRQVMHCTYQLGMTDEEIAAALGLRPSSVRKQRSRAVAAMRLQTTSPRQAKAPCRPGDERIRVTFRTTAATWARLKQLAISDRINMQSLIHSALSQELARRGGPPAPAKLRLAMVALGTARPCRAKATRGQGNRIQVPLRISASDWDRLKRLAISDRTTLRSLIHRALSREFQRRGLPPLEGWD
jgi:RNA polymerase sigma factor (sigma-70 family)